MKLSNRLSTINGAPGADDGWAVYYAARNLRDQGIDVTMLSIGDHDTPTDPIILDAMEQAARGGNTRYAPINGTVALREEIAKRASRTTGVPTNPDQVFVGNGGQGALFAALMAVTDPGDTVALIDPFYTTYLQTVRATGGTETIIAADPEDGFQIAPNALMTGTSGARAIMVNTPNNPTGAVYNGQTLEGLRAAALQNDLAVISDEVYDCQVHTGAHVSPRSLPDMADRTLVIGSLSKSHVMTGFRIGWCIGPEEIIARLTDLTNATTYGAPGFIQAAGTVALRDGARIEAETAALYTRRRNLAVKTLEGRNGIRLSAPDGAMYVMLDIRATGPSGEAFALDLLDAHRIAVMPGESFGNAAAGHIRIALTQPDETLAAALVTIADFAEARIA